MDPYQTVEKAIKSAKSFLIGSHVNPDGDAIGSTLALGAALKHLGKEVVMYNQDRVPDNLEFLAGADAIASTVPARPFDVGIMIDCAAKERAGAQFASAKITGPTIAIDHHRIENAAVDVALIDESAASAGEVIFKLINRMKIPITPPIAMSVYCTLAVDTGFFRYSNTTGRILGVAAELVEAGAVPWTVALNLEESYSVERFRLLARALDTLTVLNDGAYATMEVTQKMVAQTGAPMQISEEFAGIPRSIKSVKVSALFREVAPGKIRISLRSKNGIDVAAIAGRFGGGGHPFAAGCTISGTMDHAKKIVHDIIQEKIRSTKSETNPNDQNSNV